MDSVLDINIEYNSSAEKETIEVEIGDPEEFESKAGENIAYRTYDQLSIPNIITMIATTLSLFGDPTSTWQQIWYPFVINALMVISYIIELIFG